MSEDLERSIRGKIIELQIFLGSVKATERDLEAIDGHLSKAVDVFLDPEAREATCATS